MLAGDPKESISYAGELLQYFLTRAGITISGQIKRGEIDPAGDKLILHHLSQFTLDQVISRLMEFSNNFIANQLFLGSGAAGMGSPATLEKGVRVTERYIERHLGCKGITIVEGSGLSRQNRISAEAMMILLKQFKPYYQLLRHEGREYYKTGTLSNVKSRAGYLEDDTGRRYPYVVIINTPGKTTMPVMQLFKKAIKEISI
jgi:D-alanyl-D-alanine carboxypeptidase/D-alanyl-D-alanine-endopeptidase (penicillin-binding protein 4)